MSDKTILYFSDFDPNGSGYKNISVPICTGLVRVGYQLKALGLSYDGSEHSYPFSLIPAGVTLMEGCALLFNLCQILNPDIVIVALDIPLQHAFLQQIKSIGKKYIGITALENGPLTMSWAAWLLQADTMFFISELGKAEAQKAGVKKAEHLKIGIDSQTWRPPTPDERYALRKGLGIEDEEFVILTVADNQERKNLAAAMEAVAGLKSRIGHRVRYMLVTREHTEFGYKLRDLAVSLGINDETVIFERGMPSNDLWGLYAASDVFLLSSKAEGLGLPVMEAMACGVPVVAANTGAIPELIGDGRGYLAGIDYSFTDVWGNSKRDMVSIDDLIERMLDVVEPVDGTCASIMPSARDYIEKERQWSDTIDQLSHKIEEICNDSQTQQETE